MFLSGEVDISGVTYRGGDWARLPTGYLRTSMRSPRGALALAHFSGPARWVARDNAPSDDLSTPAPTRRSIERVVMPEAWEAENSASPLLHGRARLLHAGDPDSTWLCESPLPGTLSKVSAEIVDLRAHTWAWVEPGDPFPEMDGIVFCRVFSRSTAASSAAASSAATSSAAPSTGAGLA